MKAAGRSETARQIVHMSMGLFALLLRWLTWWQALLLASAALAVNMFVLPSVARGIYREGDSERALHGIVFYPISVAILLLFFPHRLDIVAAAWGILALGDGAATLAGRAIGGPRWRWNRDKTVAGSAALVVFGAAAGMFLAWWCHDVVAQPVSRRFILIAPIAAALIAAAVESMPVRLDDNLSVALSAGITLWLVSLISTSAAAQAWAPIVTRVPWAVLVNVAVAAGGYRVRTVSGSGAVAGATIGSVIFAALGWQGWMMLFITFVVASVASRMGLQRKMLLGIAEERAGRRGAGNAIANTGVAAVAAVLAVASVHTEAARWAFAAALAAGGSDTIASEIGKAWGRTTWSITTLAPVPPGTSGAMSMEGTAAGIFGAILLGGIAILLKLVPGTALAAIVIASTIGALIESGLGATLEAPGILNNDMLNFFNTAAAALLAIGFFART